MSLILIWLTASFFGAVLLIVVIFWFLERKFRDD
jgi:hypothetical protein